MAARYSTDSQKMVDPSHERLRCVRCSTPSRSRRREYIIWLFVLYSCADCLRAPELTKMRTSNWLENRTTGWKTGEFEHSSL